MANMLNLNTPIQYAGDDAGMELSKDLVAYIKRTADWLIWHLEFCLCLYFLLHHGVQKFKQETGFWMLNSDSQETGKSLCLEALLAHISNGPI